MKATIKIPLGFCWLPSFLDFRLVKENSFLPDLNITSFHQVRVEVTKLPSVPDCRLVIELGELRLDSSVIHRTRVSLALYLFLGSVSLLRISTASKPLLQGHFTMKPSIQALVGQGRVTSIEDVNLDCLGLRVLSCLFQHLAPVKKFSGSWSKLADLATYIPKAAQVAL